MTKPKMVNDTCVNRALALSVLVGMLVSLSTVALCVTLNMFGIVNESIHGFLALSYVAVYLAMGIYIKEFSGFGKRLDLDLVLNAKCLAALVVVTIAHTIVALYPEWTWLPLALVAYVTYEYKYHNQLLAE